MEKETYIIRAAVASDTDRLIELRSQYVRSLYKHLVEHHSLEEWHEIDAPEIGEWLQQGRYYIDVLETSGHIEGYIVYGMSGEETIGSIVEARATYPCDADRKRAMIEHAIDHLKVQGAKTVSIWLQHDNFRIRFLFESLGFHRDGTVKVDNRITENLSYDGYVYDIH